MEGSRGARVCPKQQTRATRYAPVIDQAPKASRLTRRDLWIALAVFAVALASRLVFLAASPDRSWPHSAYHEGDAIVWAQWAEAIAAGRAGEFNSGLPFYPPAVAYLIAVLGPAGAGLSYAALKVLWCAMSAGACGVAYLAFAYVFPRRVALIASAWCAFSFALGVAATSLNNETPYLLLVCLIVLGTLRLADRPRLWLAASVGLLHGLANLTRPEHTLLLMMLMGYLAWRWVRRPAPRVEDAGVRSGVLPPSSVFSPRPSLTVVRAIVMLLVVGLGFVLTCVPWSVHATRANMRYNRHPTPAVFRPDYATMTPPWEADARAFFDSLPEFCRRWVGAYLYTEVNRRAYDRVTADRLRSILLEDFGYIPEPVRAFTLVSSAGPINFALANHPGAHGEFSKVALDARFNPDPDIALSLPSHLRLYNRGGSVGLAYLAGDPGAAARSAVLKVRNFWGGVTLGLTARNLPYGRVGERRPVDLITHAPWAGPWWRAAVSAVILAGVAVAARRRQGGVWMIVILYKVAVTLLFFGYARQAVSILPAFALFGAVAIDAAAELIARRASLVRRAPIAGGLVLLALAAADLTVLFIRAVPRIEGLTRPAPRWGPDAFESVARIRIGQGPPGAPAGPGSSGPSTAAPTGTHP